MLAAQQRPPVNIDFSQIFEGISKVKLRGGVVGKVSTVLICVSAAMAAIAWSIQVIWVSVLALVFVFALCFVMLWRLINFADRNPQAALLEGAEFLAHEQIQLGMKSSPTLPESCELPQTAHEHPSIVDLRAAALPDPATETPSLPPAE